MSTQPPTDRSTTHDAIEELYQAFASCSREPLVPLCDCCSFKELEAPLSSAPLRALTADALLDYFYYAVTNCGPVSTFRHFLPRIIELSASDGRPFSTSVLADKLAHADTASWPQHERRALHVALKAVLASRPSDKGLRHAAELLAEHDEGTRETGGGA